MTLLIQFISYILLCFQSQAAVQKPVLFEITKNGNTAYIFGSVHVGVNYSDLPPVVNEKLNASSTLIVEADLENAMPLIQEAMSVPETVSLKTKLTDDEWAKLQEVLAPTGLTEDQIEFLNLATVASTYSLLASNVPQVAEPIDAFMVQVAKSTNKNVDFLESYFFQLELLKKVLDIDTLKDALAQNPQDAMADYLSLSTAYESGDIDLIYATAVEQTPNPEDLDFLLWQRNKTWIPIINEKILVPGIEMIVVGAAHLGGPDGVINLLKAEGYFITPIQ